MTAEAFAEVVGSPYDVWAAAVGTAFPAIDAEPASGTWTHLGTNGIENQGTQGVVVALARTISSFKPAGGTLKVKDWCTEEDPSVAFSLVDTTVEQLALILDDAVVTSVPAASGTSGTKSISLIRGVAVHYYALLVRGLSPYDNGSGLQCQYEFARVCQSASQSLAYVLGTPAEAACQFDIRGTVDGTDPALYLAANAAAL